MTSAPPDALRVDFLGGPVGHRFRSGRGHGHALFRAAGLGKAPDAHVVDATAGLGRDAFLLASHGIRVTMVERSPEVHALLKDAMDHAATDARAATVIARMTLLRGDAKDLLPGLGADVVIVDPMHPPRGNTALVKKEMRLLRHLVGADTDVLALMRVALATARDRVVLKWPRRAAVLPDLPKPSHQNLGKTTRYDVYITKDTAA